MDSKRSAVSPQRRMSPWRISTKTLVAASANIGGTSADFSMIQDLAPQYTTQTQVGDFPLVVPEANAAAIGEEARATLTRIAETCPVRLSLLPAIDVPLSIHWGNSPRL